MVNRRDFLKSTASLPLVASLSGQGRHEEEQNDDTRTLFGYFCKDCNLCHVMSLQFIESPDYCRNCGDDVEFFLEELN